MELSYCIHAYKVFLYVQFAELGEIMSKLNSEAANQVNIKPILKYISLN